ncbi:MAG: hypothetical protein JNN25_18670 [Candidatus Kapabacteria bacterium]|nr:hypothetical protein [Candidatus Kapabacteria bacterium]
MKYRVLCHILVFLLCVGGLLAQTVLQDSVQVAQSTQANVQAERTAKETVFLELLGNGFAYSLNYERFLSEQYAYRIGFSTLPPYYYFLPLSASYFIGQNEHRLEMGGGGVLALLPRIQQNVSVIPAFFLVLRLGYRYQPLNGGFNFAVTFTPLWDVGHNLWSPRVSPWGGISLGWSF